MTPRSGTERIQVTRTRSFRSHTIARRALSITEAASRQQNFLSFEEHDKRPVAEVQVFGVIAEPDERPVSEEIVDSAIAVPGGNRQRRFGQR